MSRHLKSREREQADKYDRKRRNDVKILVWVWALIALATVILLTNFNC